MTPPRRALRWHRPRSCALARLGWLVGGAWGTVSGGLAAQAVETTIFYDGAQVNPITLHLDSLAVELRVGVSPSTVVQALAPDGLDSARIFDDIVVFGVTGSQTRETLNALARQIEADHPNLIARAGLLVRYQTDGVPVVLTAEFFVRFQTNITQSQMDSVLQNETVVWRSVITPSLVRVRTTSRSQGDALALANAYQQSALTWWAHPAFLGGVIEQGLGQPDPFLGAQWHLNNTGQTGSGPPPTRGDINALNAWGLTEGDPGTVIAVVEVGGFEPSHPDLAPNLWHNPLEAAGIPGVDDDGNGFVDDTIGFDFTANTGDVSASSQTSHGTAVAGLAAAVGDNGVGVKGVCPKCRLMLIRAQHPPDVVAALDYILQTGVTDVINFSWTVLQPLPALKQQISIAAGTGQSSDDIPIVVAMRNKTPAEDRCAVPKDDLGALATVIAVGASNDEDHRAFNSSFGDCIDVLAPGSVRPNGTADSTVWGVTTTDSAGPANRYNQELQNITGPRRCWRPELADTDYTNCFGGTSAATAIVSGVLGLMLSRNPDLTRNEVEQLLEDSAVEIPANFNPDDAPYVQGFSPTHGNGRVDAYCALLAVDGFSNCIPPITVTCVEGNGDDCPDGEEEPAAFEVGVRFGFASVTSSENRTILNIPGGGPLGAPVLYGDWLAAPFLMLEGQLGFFDTHYSGMTPDETLLAAVLQPTFLYTIGVVQLYLGPQLALARTTIGGGSPVTEWAAGGAGGLRYRPLPFLSLRAELLYRHWTTPDMDEVGLVGAMGVVF